MLARCLCVIKIIVIIRVIIVIMRIIVIIGLIAIIIVIVASSTLPLPPHFREIDVYSTRCNKTSRGTRVVHVGVDADRPHFSKL